MRFGRLAGAMVVALSTGALAQERSIVETAVEAGDFETLATALTEAGLVEALEGEGPFTVFAPTDDAFGTLGDRRIASLLEEENRGTLTSILTYHVVPGRLTAADLAGRRTLTTLNGQRLDVGFDAGLTVDGASIVAGDVEASNGIIHVIDGVLVPETRSIPEVAKEAGAFSALLAAAKSAGLVEALSGDGPFTVFAPTDDAFSTLGTETVESLLRPESRDRLRAILSYHVVQGRVYASDVVGGASAPTLQGDDVSIGLRNGALRVNDGRVVAADVEASNGVIHVIDAVLMPPARDVPTLIGITYSHSPSSDQRDALRLDRGQGVVIGGITSGFGAGDAGLRSGDIIVTINGRPATTESIREAKAEAGPGGTVEVTFVRTVQVEVREDTH